ncbi:hypothetical protein SAMN04515671_3423 [Nakamurella panacisegetis]|uniref:Uncharacterized protein n=1 Tax=Nakamurella panacisegetis TaxID=1090615 RepID=A0A1H0R707_9ACTN|nr:hypothetical protein [Nakamurella panacisegetis]SDP25205.1 hypothetical protein SAMN04515671_3423 [Nakamurella panacisegetis]
MTTAPRPSVPMDAKVATDYVLKRVPSHLPSSVGPTIAAMVRHGLDAVQELPEDEQPAAWTPNLSRLAEAWAQNGDRFADEFGTDADEAPAIRPTTPSSVEALQRIGVCIWPFCP